MEAKVWLKPELPKEKLVEVSEEEKNKTLLWGTVTIGLVAVGIYVGTKDRNRKREKDRQEEENMTKIEKKED